MLNQQVHMCLYLIFIWVFITMSYCKMYTTVYCYGAVTLFDGVNMPEDQKPQHQNCRNLVSHL